MSKSIADEAVAKLVKECQKQAAEQAERERAEAEARSKESQARQWKMAEVWFSDHLEINCTSNLYVLTNGSQQEFWEQVIDEAKRRLEQIPKNET